MFLTNYTPMKIAIEQILLTAIVLLTPYLSSCAGDPDTEEDLALAENALREGHYEQAADICSDILQTTDSNAITVNQMCRIAIVYATAADNDCDNEGNMARAAKCFRRAGTLNADSVTAFIDALPIRQQSIADMAHRLSQGTHSDLQHYTDCSSDSIDAHQHE